MEIANIEHELALLRERHANFLVNIERMKRVTTYGGALTLAVVLGAIIYAIATNDGDAFAKLFLLIFLFTAAFLAGWLCKDTKWELSYDWSRCPFHTDEEFLRHAIAIREKRLGELKALS